MPAIRPIAAAVALLCTGLASACHAAGQTEPDPLLRVEVTGSRIKRIDAETASALQVISRADIERSGATSVTEVLRQVPAGNSGGYDAEGTPTQAFGSAGISLRGLGAGSTLTLINGRRVAPFGFGSASFVDTNAIPLAAIERIEILLDGASAIYGADAIGGVVNIILRKNYEGVEAALTGGTSAYHDANNHGASLSWGRGKLATDGYNWMLNLSHRASSPFLANARPRTANADFRRFGLSDRRSSYASNAYVASGYYGTTFLGPVGNCTPVADASSTLNGRCTNDNTASVTLQSKYQKDTLYSAATLRLDGGAEAFADLTLARSRQDSTSFSYGTDSYGAYTSDLVDKYGKYGNPAGGNIAYLLLPAGHPQNTFGKTVAVRYLFNDVPSTVSSISKNARLTLGLRATLGAWDTEAALMVSRSHTGTGYRGYIQDAVLTGEVLDADGLVRNSYILDNAGANDAGLMARLYPALNNVARTSTSSIDWRANRELMQLDGGALAVAVGAELRREYFDAQPDPLFTSGAITLFGMTGSTGSRNVAALYGEVAAPLLKSVELNLAARADRYPDFGSAFTPKLGLKWKPANALALRSTYSEGFRAPSLPEVNTGTTNGYTKIQDPKLCPDFVAGNVNCERYVAYSSGQNPDIKAEQSKNLTLGFVLEPLPRWSLSVDAYQIKRRNELATIGTAYLLDHEAQYSDRIARSAITGQIEHLNLMTANLARTSTRGLDLDMRGSVSLGAAGRVVVGLSGNRMFSFKEISTPDGDQVETSGYYLKPKTRAHASLDWDLGPWSAGVNWAYTGRYLVKSTPDASCPYQAATPWYCEVHGSLSTGVHLSYRGIRKLTLGLTVQNLANKEAPFDASRLAYLMGYNTAYHNQLGRYVQLNASYAFQ